MLDITKFLVLAITFLALVAEASWFRKGFEVKEKLVLLDSKIYQPVLRTYEARELSKSVEICKTDIFNLKLTCYRQEFDDGAQAKKRPAIVKLSQYLQGNYRVTISRGRQSRKFKIKKAIDMFGTHVEDSPISDSLFNVIVDCPNSSVHAKIINVETGKVVRTLPVHSGRFMASALERERQYILEIFAYTRRLRKFIRRPKIIYREYVNRMYKPVIETDRLNIVFDSHYNAEWFGIFPPAEEANNEVVDGSSTASAVEEESAGVPPGNLVHGYPGVGEITPTGSEEISVPPTSPADHDVSSGNGSGVDMNELLERLSAKASKGSSSSSSSFRSPFSSDFESSSGRSSGYSSSTSSGVIYHRLKDDETDGSPEFQAEQVKPLLPAGSQSSSSQYGRRSRSSSVDSFEGGYRINALANQRKADAAAEDATDSDLQEDWPDFERSSFASSSSGDLSRTNSFDRALSAFSLDLLDGNEEGSRDGPEQPAASIAQLNAEATADDYDSDLEERVSRLSSFASSISGTRARKSSFDGGAHSPSSLDGEQRHNALVSSQSQTIGSGEESRSGSQANEEMVIRDSADVAVELPSKVVEGAEGEPVVADIPSTLSIKTAGRKSQPPRFTSGERFSQQRIGDENGNSEGDDGASDETASPYVTPYVKGYTVVDEPVPEAQGQKQKGLLRSVQRAMSSFFAPNEPQKLRTPVYEDELVKAVKERSNRIN